jgi:hypothetical protein
MSWGSGAGSKTLEQYFDAAWQVDPHRTLKFVFYLRDCRGGKGERMLFRALVRHMCERGLENHIRVNMEHIPTFGYWKDLLVCFLGTDMENQALDLMANQLRQDMATLNQENARPSLCARHAPSEGGAFDREHKVVAKLSRRLKVTPREYRKQCLVPIRRQLGVVEVSMCAKLWAEIPYEGVPSLAGSRYKQAFSRHDEQRYTEYLQRVQRGETKMNTSVLMPYQIVAPYLKNKHIRDETLEAQWVSFLADRRSKWPAGMNVLPIVDVSGSMYTRKDPQAIEVAVSLGMVFSLLNTSPQYTGKFITFSSNPEILSIPVGSLQEQVSYLMASPWGMTTNFQKVFDMILNIATMFKVPQEQMPQILVVLSDMQFNAAEDGRTNWEVIESKYAAAGYRRPTIIFWNLNGTSIDYPVPNKDVPDCALLSGFNDAIMYSILEGTMPNPLEIVYRALDKERYNCIQLAE